MWRQGLDQRDGLSALRRCGCRSGLGPAPGVADRDSDRHARRGRRVQIRARFEPRPTPPALGELPGHLPGAVARGQQAELPEADPVAHLDRQEVVTRRSECFAE